MTAPTDGGLPSLYTLNGLHARISTLRESFYAHKKTSNHRLDEIESKIDAMLECMRRLEASIQRLREKVEFPDV